MTIPDRGRTSESTYFVTANVLERKCLFHVEKIAKLFIEVLLSYRAEKKCLLHEFVVMPDHIHLIITPAGITLERAMQFAKGGFSFQLNKGLKLKREPWQPSFMDRRIRDSLEYEKFKNYIWQNPVKRFLAKSAQEYPYSSANPAFKLDPVPQRLKPIALTALPAGLKACSTPATQPFLKSGKGMNTCSNWLSAGCWPLFISRYAKAGKSSCLQSARAQALAGNSQRLLG
jgi:putative transposase